LPMAGTYTVLIEPRYYTTEAHDYSFRVTTTGNTPPADLSTGTTLTIAATVSGSLASAGATDLYTFTTTGAQRLYFDSLTYDLAKTWTLVGPRGVESDAVSFGRSDSWERSGNLAMDLPLPGTYQLRVSGSAGSYSFRMLDLG